MPLPVQKPDELRPLPPSLFLLYVAAGAWTVVAVLLGSRFWPDPDDRSLEVTAAVPVLLCLLAATTCWVGAAVVNAVDRRH
jgi:hypothetical protein